MGLTQRDSQEVVREVAARLVADYSAESMVAALHAACSAPGGVHRLPSLTALWAAALVAPPTGDRVAGPVDVERWVARLRNAVPSFERSEDWIPLDPAAEVRVFHRGGLWPVHPGLLERPLELIALLERWAKAADAQAVERFGFGFADLVEVGLRIIATERREVVPVWDGRQAVSPEEPVSIGEGEIEAMRELLDRWRRTETVDGFPSVLLEVTGGVAHDDDDPGRLERLGRALEFATVDLREAAETARPALDRIDRIGGLAVRSGDGVVPVPASLVLDGLAGLSVRLLGRFAPGGSDEEAGKGIVETLEREGERVLRNSLENLLAHVLPVTLESDDARYWVVCPSARHVVLVAVVAGLSVKEGARAVKRARKVLSRAALGAMMRCVGEPPPHFVLPSALSIPVDPSLFGGSGCVARDATVTRVVLVDGACGEYMRRHHGQVVLSVDEWRFLTAQIRVPEELWSFLEELSQLPGLNHVAAFDLRDLWAVFHKRGVLEGGGVKQRYGFIPPQDLYAEWSTAQILSRVEEMLRGWGMGGVGAWPAYAVDEDGAVALWSLALHGRAVANPAAGFAVATVDSDRRVDHYFADLLVENIHATLRTLAQTGDVADGRDHSDEGWSAWRDAGAGRPVLIELLGAELDEERAPVRLAVLDGGDRIVLEYDETRLRYLSCARMHYWLGAALADAVLAMRCMPSSPSEVGQQVMDFRELAHEHPEAAVAREVFLQSWLAVAPSLRVFHFQGLSARPATVFGAAHLTEQGRNRAGRSIAGEVVRRKIPAQSATGVQATALLAEICQAAVGALRRELAGFDGKTALLSAAEEVERIWEVRTRDEPERAMREGLSARDHAREEIDAALTARAGDFLLETLLHDAPTGTRRLDHRDWISLIHLAAECIHLSTHLNAAQCGLLQVSLHVQADGLVRLGYGDTLMDLPLHQEHRATANARWIASMIEERALDAEPGEDNPFRSMRAFLEHTAQHPENRGDERGAGLMLAVDDALIAEMGTSLDAINALLATAAAWPVPGDPFALTATVPREELVTSAAVWSALPADRIETALALLTLTKELLATEGIKYWSLEGRNARLGLRPIIALDDRRNVMILPRRAVGARRVLANYHADCRLPWPSSTLPKPVHEALRTWRKARERDFETEVDHLFRDHGIACRRPALLPRKAIKAGLEIAGEIDLLAADPSRRIMWVVEAKDQHIPFDPYQLASEVVDFHGLPQTSTLAVTALQARPPEKAFVGKLLTKTEQVRDQLAAALRVLGLASEDVDGWTVLPLIVTSRPCAAAAVARPRVTFATTTDLDTVLRNPH
jgi:hypothetical protein